MRNLLVFPLLFLTISLMAQSNVNIAIINDEEPDNSLESTYQENVEEEIRALLQHRHEISLNFYYGLEDKKIAEDVFTKAYANNDILVIIGRNTSNYAIGLKNYPKPTVASFVIDSQLQGLPSPSLGNSGIKNFTYLESPLNISRDLNLLYEIYPFEHLEVLTEEGAIGESTFVKQLFANYLKEKNVTVNQVLYSEDLAQYFSKLEDKKVAVYALPYLGSDTSKIQQVFDVINQNKIPSSALLGEEYIQAGALTGFEISKNLLKTPRRIALNVMKIIEGQKAEELPIQMQIFSDGLLINMETARQIDIYPDFDLMSKATLVNLDSSPTNNKWTLQKAIAYALQNNLNVKIEQVDIDIANTEIGLANSDLLPQLEASGSFAYSDEFSTLINQGATGRGNFSIAGNFSQIVFSEPTLANRAIQKLLKKGAEQQFLQTQLDVVIDVATAYMNILFAKSNLDIQQQNVARNKDNFDISKAKQAIGYSGATDINRWESELANANIELNNAVANLRQAKFQLNQLLNLPINEPINIVEAKIAESMLIFSDERMVLINNYGSLNKLANFLVTYGKKNLPELTQVDLNLRAQQRLQLSRERAIYLPSLALSGSASRVLGRVNIPEGLTPLDKVTTWDIALGVSYPIFQGNRRRKLVEQSKLNVIQLEHSRKNTENQLEVLIRSNLTNVGASYSQMELARAAADASQKNYKIVQDAYSAGQSNITNLIDAQNNKLTTELQANNAVYTFILDFLNLERSIGYFNFLATPEEKNNFFQEIQLYFN